jgi:predicted transcriptional regulator
MEQYKSKRGRPETSIEWPEGEFTAEQVFKMNIDKVSRVSVHNKINRGVKLGTLVRVKRASNKIGRPSWLYAFTNAVEANEATDQSSEVEF